jgi:hypothetical protein
MRGIFFVNAPQKEQARNRVPVLFGCATLFVGPRSASEA